MWDQSSSSFEKDTLCCSMSSQIFIFSYAPNSVFLLAAPSFLLLEFVVRVLHLSVLGLPPFDIVFFMGFSVSSTAFSSCCASKNFSYSSFAFIKSFIAFDCCTLGDALISFSARMGLASSFCLAVPKNFTNHIALVVWMMILKLVKLRWMLVYLVSWTDLKASWQFSLKLTMFLPSAPHHAKSELPPSWLLQWWQLHPCPCCSRVLADWNSSSALSPNKAGPWIKLRPSNPWSCASLALFEVSFQFVTVIVPAH